MDKKSKKIKAVQIGLASPERILEWSFGEVLSPETLNYRSQKPVPGGLFCERIFGPEKDGQCYCEKYKKSNLKGIKCDNCGVELISKDSRRERMGHIELAAPVSHIWYLKGQPSILSVLLDIPLKNLEEIIYFVAWIVTDPMNSNLPYKTVLSEQQHREDSSNFYTNPDSRYVAMTGAKAIKTLLEQIDCKAERSKIEEELEKASGDKRKKLIKRLEIVNAFIDSNNKPEWLILTRLPVLPPQLRPMLPLDGGRFATSDLNDLYRRIITRNNRLKDLIDKDSPDLIIRNEMRMLQEAVDTLIDNGRRSNPIKASSSSRPLKSLSHALKGKGGRFRQNLLGKRVDYSARSVITVGPELKLYECGIPKEMAKILYRHFLIRELHIRGYANSLKACELLLEKDNPEFYSILQEIMDDHPVLLNRAPTLHRLGIQAFIPKLVNGKAIRLHPLTCTAFNADFDGDQMAVHLPLSEKARAEAMVLMLGSHNILGPKDGKPIVTPSQDMILGNFYLNMEETAEEFYDKAKQLEAIGDYNAAKMWRSFGDHEGHVYRDFDEAMLAYNNKQIHLHTRIAIRANSLNKDFTEKQKEGYILTTVGKLIFNSKFPSDFPYISYVDKEKKNLVTTDENIFIPKGVNIKEEIKKRKPCAELTKDSLSDVIAAVYNKYEKNSSSESNLETTSKILDEIKDLGFYYSTIAGITVSLSDINVAPNKHKYVSKTKAEADKIQYYLKRGLITLPEWEKLFSDLWNKTKDEIGDEVMSNFPRKSPINMMAVSKARGNKSHFTQLAGMRGLMARPTQSKSNKEYQPKIIEVPIYSSFREGLNVSEFFISTHGVRKGLTDTALKTAESGYLTRRLVDASQQVFIKEYDCETDRDYIVEDIVDTKSNSIIEPLYSRIVGRYAKADVIHPKEKYVIVSEDEYISEDKAKEIIAAGIKQVNIRNVFTCISPNGICAKCYGKNMATGKLVEVGEAVGIMAAQSIGEPGTQLTMRTFHTGGVASAEGDITQGLPRIEELFEARRPKGAAVISKIDGTITSIHKAENATDTIITITNETESIDHKLNLSQALRDGINEGAKVKAGDKLCEGNIDPKALLQVAGVRAAQNYILKEVKRVYSLQGIDLSDKHVEIIISQMLRKIVITDAGDTNLIIGQTMSLSRVTNINKGMLMEGKAPAKFSAIMFGITKSAAETDSFLSAASFQETTKALTNAAIFNKTDYLEGLKENVILGKKIPSGTGCDNERESTREINELASTYRQKRIEENESLKEGEATPDFRLSDFDSND